MSESKSSGTDPKVPAERADLKTPESGSGSGTDRPGFDLGGAKDKSAAGGATTETGPRTDPTLGDAHPTGRSQLTSNKATPA